MIDIRSKIDSAVAVLRTFKLKEKASELKGALTSRVSALWAKLAPQIKAASDKLHGWLNTMLGKLIVTALAVSLIFAAFTVVRSSLRFTSGIPSSPAKIQEQKAAAQEAPTDWRTVATVHVEPSASQATQVQEPEPAAAAPEPAASEAPKAPAASAPVRIISSPVPDTSVATAPAKKKTKKAKAATAPKASAPLFTPEWFSEVFNSVFGSTT